MFTGIVEELGHVRAIAHHGDHATLTFSCSRVLEDVELGASIAVAGCCLTVTSFGDGSWTADLIAETLRATSLGDLTVGDAVNLERAMSASQRFGGHIVQGHVDAVGTVVGRDEQPGTVYLMVAAPPEVARYVVAKGSITVDGCSLTVVDVGQQGPAGATFRIGLIPHTLEVTTFGQRVVGERVNLEADVIAKYTERMLQGGTASPYRALGNQE